MKVILSHIVMGAAACLAGAAQAETLDRIRDTGVVTMGVREASGTMSYTLGNGKYAGFHVELCEKALARMQQQLKLPRLDIRYQMVTAQNRVPLVANGTVDVECGTTTNNAARQKEVAFAPTVYMEEVRTAVRKSSGITEVAQLKGRNVAATTGATAVTLLRRFSKEKGVDFNVLMAKDNAECFILLETGRADACVADGQILASGLSRLRDPGQYAIVGEPFSVEPIAIMLDRKSPEFKKLFDAQIRELASSGEVAALYDKWFMKPVPPTGVAINLPASEATRAAWAAPSDKPLEDYAAVRLVVGRTQ